jgi:type VI secretion system secreted protein VgrG
MPAKTQENWPIAVSTPLGPDVLSLVGFTAEESLSRLFTYHLDLIAENQAEVPFEKLLGQSITLELGWSAGQAPREKKRFFNGICSRIAQGERDKEFTSFRMEVVPRMWLLTRRVQSRIFQHVSVPEILEKVLANLKVTSKLHGKYEPRDFCVQYRETDFNFACRLMEEEGIYFYFQHENDKHTLILADTPAGHADMTDPNPVKYYKTGEVDKAFTVEEWEKVQELRSGKYTLWDHCFEMPHKHLDASKSISPSVQVGGVTHKLQVGNNGQLEIRDWPGGYSQRFDGISKGGSPEPAELEKIFKDNVRTTGIRMEQEAVLSLSIQGAGNCRNFIAGHKFKLDTLDGSLEKELQIDGDYVLTRVQHSARVSGYRSGDVEFEYQNRFQCIPAALPYRPQRTIEKPVVQGTQTAVVVGPAGDEIFTDKYGRVKVQFHWDAEGKNNADSACWCRVATPWAGKQWGMIHIPRIGQEVIVAFEEGDADKPIIVGSVFNAEQMPPYGLPGSKTQSGIKTRSSLGGSEEDFNEICFEDKKGEELLYIRAQKDQIFAVENDQHLWAGNDRTKEVDHDEDTKVHHDRTESVGNNETITIGVEGTGNRTETVKGDESITIKGNRTEEVRKDETITIKGNRTEEVKEDEGITIVGNRTKTVKKDETTTINGNRTENVKQDETITISGQRTESVTKTETVTVKETRTHKVGQDDILDVGKVLGIKAGKSITLTTGKATITMTDDGNIIISGVDITIDAKGEKVVKAGKNITMKGQKILQN